VGVKNTFQRHSYEFGIFLLGAFLGIFLFELWILSGGEISLYKISQDQGSSFAALLTAGALIIAWKIHKIEIAEQKEKHEQIMQLQREETEKTHRILLHYVADEMSRIAASANSLQKGFEKINVEETKRIADEEQFHLFMKMMQIHLPLEFGPILDNPDYILQIDQTYVHDILSIILCAKRLNGSFSFIEDANFTQWNQGAENIKNNILVDINELRRKTFAFAQHMLDVDSEELGPK